MEAGASVKTTTEERLLELQRQVESLTAQLSSAREAAREEKAARQAVEQTVLLGEARAMAHARRWRVSGVIGVTGLVVFMAASPLTFLGVFGLVTDGAFGYALGACSTAYCVMLLAVMPTDAKVIRFVGGFTLVALVYWALIFVVASVYIGVGNGCPYGTSSVCSAVSVGVALFALGCLSIITPFAWTLRQREGSHRVPAHRACRKILGKKAGAVAFCFAAPVFWAIVQDDDSFVLSPRASLKWYWRIFRTIFFAWAIMWMSIVAAALCMGVPWSDEPVLASLIAGAACFCLVAAAATEANRGRAHERLGRLSLKSEAKAAAGIASLLGGMAPKDAMVQAQKVFRVLPFSSLKRDDFASNGDTGLRAHTLAASFGRCDCFLSHSWHDPADAKWQVLQAWAADFEAIHGRSPLIWLVLPARAAAHPHLSTCCPLSRGVHTVARLCANHPQSSLKFAAHNSVHFPGQGLHRPDQNSGEPAVPPHLSRGL